MVRYSWRVASDTHSLCVTPCRMKDPIMSLFPPGSASWKLLATISRAIPRSFPGPMGSLSDGMIILPMKGTEKMLASHGRVDARMLLAGIIKSMDSNHLSTSESVVRQPHG